ncbi:MAG: helix-turn-helix domain-containing protein [Ruminococcaceae bacterium]|nr:helix-turn-helix domain-containing protein [Oscillospiraceae bacterium]
MDHFVITKFNSIFIAHDPAGRKLRLNNRKSACFIITVKGKIHFTYENGSLIAQAGTPVFLPKGLSYLNACMEDAESYVFNFQTLEQNHPPMQLSAVSDFLASEYYERINAIVNSSALPDRFLIFETLYSLAGRLMGSYAKNEKHSPFVTKALQFISQNYENPNITVKAIADYCCISEVYLRKLFQKELYTSPFQKITEMRMNKARMLVDEKRPLKEIADAIGYSDVFQFSRAYKRFFGHAPSKSCIKETFPSDSGGGSM